MDNCIKANESILLKLSAERLRTKIVNRNMTAKDRRKNNAENSLSLRGNLKTKLDREFCREDLYDIVILVGILPKNKKIARGNKHSFYCLMKK
jgi:hypothetical protein